MLVATIKALCICCVACGPAIAAGLAIGGCAPVQTKITYSKALCDTDQDCYDKFCVDPTNDLYDAEWCES